MSVFRLLLVSVSDMGMLKLVRCVAKLFVYVRLSCFSKSIWKEDNSFYDATKE